MQALPTLTKQNLTNHRQTYLWLMDFIRSWTAYSPPNRAGRHCHKDHEQKRKSNKAHSLLCWMSAQNRRLSLSHTLSLSLFSFIPIPNAISSPLTIHASPTLFISHSHSLPKTHIPLLTVALLTSCSLLHFTHPYTQSPSDSCARLIPDQGNLSLAFLPSFPSSSICSLSASAITFTFIHYVVPFYFSF